MNNLTKIVGGLAILGSLTSGCTSTNSTKRMANLEPTYSTNASQGLKEDSFSDGDFNTSRSTVRFAKGEYIFGPIGDQIVTINGNQVDSSAVFPYFGMPANQAIESINPRTQRVEFEPVTGEVSVFIRDSRIASLQTNRIIRESTLPDDVWVGEVSESKFYVPAIGFGNGIEVPYATLPNEDLALVNNPIYRLNRQTGLVELAGDIYVEAKGRLSPAPTPEPVITPEVKPEPKVEEVKAQIIYKQVNP